MSIKILLVEDNDINRDMLSQRLGEKGFIILEAGNGLQVFDILKEQVPDLILMDLSLPGMDGWDVTGALKSDTKTSSIPIIALTAHALKADEEAAFAAGCDDYDVKPINFDRLLKKIEKLISSH